MRAAIFDMDGLMLDTERVSALAFDYAGERTGIGPAGYITERILGLSRDEARPVWLAEFGDGYDEEAIVKYSLEFKEKYYITHDIPVKPGLFSILDYLRSEGFGLAVASSTERKTVMRELSSVGALEYFDALVCGDDVRRSKPDPEIYTLACGAVGEPPEECYALEDSRSGVLSAHAAGCRVILVPDLWRPDAETLGIVHAVCPDLCCARELIMREKGK